MRRRSQKNIFRKGRGLGRGGSIIGAYWGRADFFNFGDAFWVPFLGCFLGAQRGPKGSPKWSKIDQKEVQKRYLEKGTKKAPKMMIFMTLRHGSSIVNSSKIDVFQCSVLEPFWVPFWWCFGSLNGGQEHQKEVPKSLSISG